MLPIADLHTHTIASGHAFNTLNEMARAAREKGLQAVAITDHGPAMPHTCDPFYFENLALLPETVEGVRLIKGIEANIVDAEGHLDLAERYLERLEFVIASFHEGCIQVGTVEQNTATAIKCLLNPLVKVIGHPGNPMFPLDYDALVQAAVRLGKCIEINNASLVRTRHGSEKNCKRIAELCTKYGAMVVLGSDAHFSGFVGDLDAALRLIREARVPECNVVNYSMERVLGLLGQHKNSV
ncbi:MAG TPA: phosphatase [Firmicutes bacterium]|nr:phosphatase [Bacillota bacterium]